MEVKELILDYSKWRCGYATPNECKHQLGEGAVRLLNSKGFMCCIGQFSIQLGAKDSEILDKAYLCYVNEPVPPFTKLSKFGGHEDSELASDCIIINDDPETTPEVKIKLLTERLAKEGVVLKVINKPH